MNGESDEREGKHRLLVAVAWQGAALASPLPVLLFGRGEISERLNHIGSEIALVGVIAVVACLGMPRLRDKLPAGTVLMLGGLLASLGLVLMAWTVEFAWFFAGAALLAAGVAPGLVTHRILLATDVRSADRFRTLSWYWAAVAAGASWPLLVGVLTPMAPETALWICAALMLSGALMMGRHALVHDDDIEVEFTVGRLDVPWARRSLGAAFVVGALVFGGAEAAQSLLLGEWQRTYTQNAAVLAAGPGAALLICLFGPWYHRLHQLSGSRRADAIGTQLLVAGILVFLGSLSFTYIGLVVCWLVAGGAVVLAAVGLDAAVFTGLAPDIRRRVAALQVLWAGLGGSLALLVNAHFIGSWSSQWKVGWLGLLLFGMGWTVRRFATPARDTQKATVKMRATTMPRRVYSHHDGPPLLSVERVSVAYGSVQVLFDVDLRVQEGSVVALLGTNGAGKTTLLRAISGLEPTIDGRIVYAGLDITKTRPTWRIGMGLHQIVGGETVVGSLTVAENLRLFSHGKPRSSLEEDIVQVYELFPRLAERSNQRASTLSGGEKQMLSLAKAILVPPRLLMIDEFSLGLAPKIVAELLPVVRRIADQGSAVLLVEQSVNIALSVSDYAYVMEKGEIGHQGPAEELRAKPDLLQAVYIEGLARAIGGDDKHGSNPGMDGGS